MSRRTLTSTFAFTVMLLGYSAAWAHFLFIVPGKGGTTINVYFSEGAEPGESDLVEKIATVQAWKKTADGKPEAIKLRKEETGLVADIPAGEISAAKPVIYGLSHPYGVISRGGDTFLLKYHAASLAAVPPVDWSKLAGSTDLPLQVIPTLGNGELKVKVLWNKKPLAKAEVIVSVPGEENQKLATDESGETVAKLNESTGLVSVRSKNSETVSGKLDDKEYGTIRHYSTVTLSVPEAK